MRIGNFAWTSPRAGDRIVIMKSVFWIGCLVLSLASCASMRIENRLPANDAQLGKELPLKISDSGVPAFGFSFSLASDPDGMSALLSVSAKLSQDELKNLPSVLKLNFYDRNRNAYVMPWNGARELSRSDMVMFQNKIADKAALKAVLPNLNAVYLVFASSDGKPLYNVDLGLLCKNHPDIFRNITDEKHCNEITEKDVEAQ